MGTDLVVLGRDPLFGGGARAQTEAFLSGARTLGRTPELFFDPHPGLRGPRLTWRRAEALRQFAWSKRQLPPARSIWVVSTHATDGGPAVGRQREFDSWIGTTVEAEFRAREHGLGTLRRRAGLLSLPWLRSIERDTLRQTRRLFATSDATRRELVEIARRDDVTVLPIPIDLERFVPAVSWPPPEPTAIFVGRADDPRKNVGLLLEVARRLPELRVLLVGSPPTAPTALPTNVVASGIVDDVAPALAQATLFVLPSFQEGFGIAAAEALAAGLPVVTTPSGGPEELVRASGAGRVLGTFSGEEMAAVITQLLADVKLLTAMRTAGRAYVEREHSRERFLNVLEPALT